MLSSKNTRSSRLLFYAILFLLLALPVIGQESLLEDLIPPPALFTIVAPFPDETVSGEVIFIIKPHFPLSRSQIELVDAPASFKQFFSSDNAYSVSWSSHAVDNGVYTFLVDACDDSRCESQKLSVTVSNPVISSEDSPAPLVSSPDSNVSSSSDVPPSAADVPSPSIEPSSNSIVVSPSNYFGLFRLSGKDDFSQRSSGDSFIVSPGTYSASANFIHTNLRVDVDNASLDSTNVFFHLDENVLSDFARGNETYDVFSSFELTIPYSFDAASFSFAGDSQLVTFACLSWSYSSKSCSSDWVVLPSAPRFQSDFSSNSVVFGTASLRPLPVDTNTVSPPDVNSSSLPDVPVIIDTTLPDVNGDANTSPPSIVLFSITPSATPSILTVVTPDSERAPIPWGSSASLPLGTYSFDISFLSGDFQSVYLDSAFVDRSTVLTSFSPVVEPFTFDYNSSPFISHHASLFSTSLLSSRAVVSLHNPLRDFIFSCSSWDASSFSCASPWEPVPFDGSAYSFSTASPSTLVVFARSLDVNISDTNAELPIPLDEDALLTNAVWALKNTHSNKHFFLAENSRENLLPLSTLFSSIDISLQCDPRSPSLLPAVPLSPRRVFSTPLSDSNHTAIGALPLDSNNPSSEPLPPDVSPFYSPENILFFSNEWEDALTIPASSRESEDTLSCDGFSLVNTFEDRSTSTSTDKTITLGETISQVKHVMAVTNNSDIIQTRHVVVRFVSPFTSLESDAGIIRPSSRYQRVPSRGETQITLDTASSLPVAREYTVAHNAAIRFRDNSGNYVGRYDFSDLIQTNFSPDVVVHSRDGESVIETVIPVTVLPGETVYLDPLLDLANQTNYALRWFGVTRDYASRTTQVVTITSDIRTPGVQFFDLDGNGYANDVIIGAAYADVNGKTDAGAVYMILDVDKKTGYFDLNNIDSVTARWNGRLASDFLGSSGGSDSSIKVVNTDGNARANDLLIGASLADYVASNVGCVFLIKDIHTKRGFLDLNHQANYSASWCGTTASDQLTFTSTGGDGMQLINADNNASANDLLLRAAVYDINSSRTDVGGIFLIKDANRYSGINLLSNPASYSLRITGARLTDQLGTAQTATESVFLANLDDNSYANDLLISASLHDPAPQATNQGGLYMLLDIDTKVGTLDFNNTSTYNAKWHAQITTDSLGGGATRDSGYSVYLVDADGNTGQSGSLRNDIIIPCPLCNDGGTDRGTIFYINDINRRSGDMNLSSSANYTRRWIGATNTDQIGYTNGSGDGIRIVDIDGNGLTNDMIISSTLHNFGRTDNGVVFLIKDFPNLSASSYTLNTTTTNFSMAVQGARNTDFLGDVNYSRTGVQLVNLDGNALANDLIVAGSRINGGTAGAIVDAGCFYIILDISQKTGTVDLTSTTNVHSSWCSHNVNDWLGQTNNSGSGIQLVNVDGNSLANDLILTAPYTDVNFTSNLRDNGAVYLIKDIYNKSSFLRRDLNNPANYNLAWYGGSTTARLGDVNRSGQGVKLVNVDGNSVANDLLIGAAWSDFNAANQGRLTLILDIGTQPDGNFDMNLESSYYLSFRGSTLNDQLTSSPDSNNSFNAIDVDNNGYSNDLWIAGAFMDTNGRADNGSVFLIRDVVSVPLALVSPDINLVAIDAFPDDGDYPVFNYFFDGNLTLDFNVIDPDATSLLLDINYSSSSTPYTGTSIVDNVELTSLPSSGGWYCADTTFTNTTTCGVDWNIFSIPDGNYWIHLTLTDDDGQVDQNTSDRSVGVRNLPANPPIDVNGTLTIYSSYSTSDVTVVNGAGFTNIVSVPSSRFVQDHNYLIMVSSVLSGTANAARPNSRLVHGLVPFDTVEEVQEIPAASGSSWVYSSFILWQAASQEDVNFQLDCLGTGDCYTVNTSMLVFDLNKLERNVDWFYDENTTRISAMNDTWSDNLGATLTFTPDGKSDYLLLGNAQFLSNGAGNTFFEMELHDGTSTLDYVSRDTEDVDDIPILSAASILESPAAVSRTFRLRFLGRSTHDLNSSRLFALRLNAFATFDSNVVDQNYLITNDLTPRAHLNMTLGKDGNVVSLHSASVIHERGTVPGSFYDFQAHVDDINYFSADGNQIRVWSGVPDFEGSENTFNFVGLSTQIPDVSSHSYSTKFISMTIDPFTNASAVIRAGVVAFSHRLSGDLNLLWDHPGSDGNSYSTGVTFPVSGRVYCEDYNCGLVSARLQYCTNATCTDFYDINSTSGAPLELVSGSIPDTNSDLNAGQFYDVNWTVVANVAGTYELRIYASGSTSELNYTDPTQRTITATAVADDFTFVLLLPSTDCFPNQGNLVGGSTCQRAWFDAADLNGLADENELQPEGQRASTQQAFFVIDNQSSTSSDLNIILNLNQALTSSIVLKASTSNTGYQGSCSGIPSSGCIILTSSPLNVGTSIFSGGTQDLNIYFWVDYVSASAGQVDRNVDTNSIAP